MSEPTEGQKWLDGARATAHGLAVNWLIESNQMEFNEMYSRAFEALQVARNQEVGS